MASIGKYEIVGLLGRGGMGKVYLVSMPAIKKITALKLLDPNPFLTDLIGSSTIKKMFEKEATTMATIRHPHVVSVLDYGEISGQPYYLMEYFCTSLGQVIGESVYADEASRTVPIDRAISVTDQILSGLAALHYHGIIHRDIKPYNLLVTDENQIKICDFGLSKLRGETYNGPPNLKIGSPWYAPPEQEMSPDSVDSSADTYATGVILYRLLTGYLPDIDNIIPPSSLNADLSPGWDNFIAKAMSRNPENRFSSALDMKAELRVISAEWRKKKELSCQFIETEIPKRSWSVPVLPIRHCPCKIPIKSAASVFDTDALWRPESFILNSFSESCGMVEDAATNLIWSQNVSPYPVSWYEADQYIGSLNDKSYGGICSWRLPTISELTTLLQPAPAGTEYCTTGPFDTAGKHLWSADTNTHTKAWFVDVDMGYIGRQDKTGFYHVLAVSSNPPCETVI